MSMPLHVTHVTQQVEDPIMSFFNLSFKFKYFGMSDITAATSLARLMYFGKNHSKMHFKSLFYFYLSLSFQNCSVEGKT